MLLSYKAAELPDPTVRLEMCAHICQAFPLHDDKTCVLTEGSTLSLSVAERVETTVTDSAARTCILLTLLRSWQFSSGC